MPAKRATSWSGGRDGRTRRGVSETDQHLPAFRRRRREPRPEAGGLGRRQCLARRLVRPGVKFKAVGPAYRQAQGRDLDVAAAPVEDLALDDEELVLAVEDELRAHPLEIEAERVHGKMSRGIEAGGRRRCRDDPLAAKDRSADEPDEDEGEHRRLRHRGQPRGGRAGGTDGTRSRSRAAAGPTSGSDRALSASTASGSSAAGQAVGCCSRKAWNSSVSASSSSVSSGSPATKKVSRQAAQRTMRPSAPICAGSIMYSLAQDGQTISMANQTGGSHSTARASCYSSGRHG